MFDRLMKRFGIKSAITAKIILFAAIGIIAVFAVMSINQQRNTAVVLVGQDMPEIEIDTRGYGPEGNEAEAAPRLIMVYVSGEVYNSGVFEFYEGARIVHAIEAAGGMTEDADENAINLAAVLTDGQHIVVFSIADNMPPTVQAGGETGLTADGLVNINTATSEQLQTLSRIGPVTAGNIISHREARGGFATIEEIMNVSGIGPATFEGIRDRITVD